MQGIALLLVLNHAGICLAELLFVKSITKALASLSHFLLNFFVVLSDLIFDEHIGAIALL